MNFLHNSTQWISRLNGILLMGIVATSACGGPQSMDPTGTPLQVSPKALTLEAGKTSQFVAVSALAGSSRPVTWTSSNPGVATVSREGVVTGVTAGTATILASSDGANARSAVTITTPVRQLQLSPQDVTVGPGEKVRFVVAPTPAPNDLPVTWATSNDAVATVSDMGVVTGVAAGKATITAASDGATATSTVIVTDPPVGQVRISPAAVTVQPGEKAQFLVAAPPAAHDMPVTWTTSNDAVATVSDMGVVTGVSGGRATIMATTDGTTATSTVTVTDPPARQVRISPEAVTIQPGEKAQFFVALIPANNNVPITWATSNDAVATVSDMGVVTGVSGGRATITAISNGATVTATVTVTDPTVMQIRISPDAVTVQPGEKTLLVVASTPARSDMSVTWATSNDAVATVNDMGVVTGLSGGRATITATGDGATATSTVTVTDPMVMQIRISPDAVTVQPGEKRQLVVASTPARSDMSVAWASTNDAVATVSNMGVVTGVGAGQATITAASDGATATSTVTVAAPASYGLWPNEPPGMTLLSDWGFDGNVPVGEDEAMGGAWYINNNNGNASRMNDATAPSSAPYVLQVAYPSGFGGGSAPATAYFIIPKGHGTELYVGFWWKASDPWQGHNSDVNKLLFIYTDSTTGAGSRPAFMPEMFGPPGGPYSLRTSIWNLTPSEPRNWAEANVGDGTLVPGRWYRIEIYAKHGTSPTSYDGVLKQWVNGVLVTDYSDINYLVSAFDCVEISPTWGGTGDAKTETDFFLFDQFRVSGR